MDNRTTHTGQQLQRPVDKAAQAKRQAAQAKRIAAHNKREKQEANLAALRAKYAAK